MSVCSLYEGLVWMLVGGFLQITLLLLCDTPPRRSSEDPEPKERQGFCETQQFPP